jgi:hypothetical protein
MSLTWWNCARGVRRRLDALGPGDDHRVARAAEVRGDELGVRNGVLPAQAQPAWYMLSVFGDRPAHRGRRACPARPAAARRCWDVVLRQQLADGAVLALGAGTVVAEDVDDERVVAQAERSSPSTSLPTWTSVCSTKPAKISISRAGRAAGLGDAVPGGMVGARRQLRVRPGSSRAASGAANTRSR